MVKKINVVFRSYWQCKFHFFRMFFCSNKIFQLISFHKIFLFLFFCSNNVKIVYALSGRTVLKHKRRTDVCCRTFDQQHTMIKCHTGRNHCIWISTYNYWHVCNIAYNRLIPWNIQRICCCFCWFCLSLFLWRMTIAWFINHFSPHSAPKRTELSGKK